MNNTKNGSSPRVTESGDLLCENSIIRETLVFKGKQIRAVVINGDYWFVVKDLCMAIGLVQNSNVIAEMDDSLKRFATFKNTLGKKDRFRIVSRSGAIQVAFSSVKPDAKAMFEWLRAIPFPLDSNELDKGHSYNDETKLAIEKVIEERVEKKEQTYQAPADHILERDEVATESSVIEKSEVNDLIHQTFISEDGIEVIINTETGESFCSIKGYARLSGVTQGAISKRVARFKGVSLNGIKTVQIQTAGGLQGVSLIPENLIAQWIPSDNPKLATAMLIAGTRVFLHNLAGFKVESSATKAEEVKGKGFDDIFESFNILNLKAQDGVTSEGSTDDSIALFDFKGHDVRVIPINGEPWFVAKDLCDVLDITNIRQNLDKLDDDEKGVYNTYTPGGNQEMSIVSESGMYALVLKSRKPQAKAFRKWVTSEVLPSIRKTGGYIVAKADGETEVEIEKVQEIKPVPESTQRPPNDNSDNFEVLSHAMPLSYPIQDYIAEVGYMKPILSAIFIKHTCLT